MQSYDARLMSGRLPELIDPIRLADEGVRLQGKLKDGMARLHAMRRPGSQPVTVEVDLQFERGAPSRRCMRGRIYAEVEMVCQRCLHSIMVPVEAKPNLTLLQTDERAVAEDEDTLTVDAPVRLSELVEDELLLTLPMVPLHADTECNAGVKVDVLPISAQKENPFAVLNRLKDK